MKITLFTSNKPRHNYLINFLSKNCRELFVIQECSTLYPGKLNGNYKKSKILENYFSKVKKAEIKIFKNNPVSGKNINHMSIQSGDLNQLNLSKIKSFLKSDLYIVFGSSFIKGKLVKFLIKKKAINIHMGISPYYRGTDCNFWALHDKNPKLVGATIHFLSKGLDSGEIIGHAISESNKNLFIYTMSTVKSAFYFVKKKILQNSIKKIKAVKQNKNSEIRYSKISEFNEKSIKKFFKNSKKLNWKNKYQLINQFKLKKEEFLI